MTICKPSALVAARVCPTGYSMGIGGERLHRHSPAMTAIKNQLKAAEAIVNAIDYNAPGWQQKWDEAMTEVRRLRGLIEAGKPAEEFCSVDSGGLYRTRLMSGRIV